MFSKLAREQVHWRAALAPQEHLASVAQTQTAPVDLLQQLKEVAIMNLIKLYK